MFPRPNHSSFATSVSCIFHTRELLIPFQRVCLLFMTSRVRRLGGIQPSNFLNPRLWGIRSTWPYDKRRFVCIVSNIVLSTDILACSDEKTKALYSYSGFRPLPNLLNSWWRYRWIINAALVNAKTNRFFFSTATFAIFCTEFEMYRALLYNADKRCILNKIRVYHFYVTLYNARLDVFECWDTNL